jgi:catechol 2,3-dioxygenase-like lactoylglutathione lyase family enzyme
MNRPTEKPAVLTMEGAIPLFQVFDMRTSLAFYRDVLGFRVIQSAPEGASDDGLGWAWLRHGDVDLMLNTAYDPNDVRPPQPEARRIAAHGDTELFIRCPDVDAAYRYLRERGIGVKSPETASYGMKQLFVTDPDGFGLCFQRPGDAS